MCRYTTIASEACMSQRGRWSSSRRNTFWPLVGIVRRDVCRASSRTASTTSLLRSWIAKERVLLARTRHFRHLREVCMAEFGCRGYPAGGASCIWKTSLYWNWIPPSSNFAAKVFLQCFLKCAFTFLSKKKMNWVTENGWCLHPFNPKSYSWLWR